jgi:hypothetical protein
LDERALIPVPRWAGAEAVDRAWIVAAAWLFGLSGLVAVYMALTGIAAADPLHVLAIAPAAALIAAFAVLDAGRAWTVRLGALAGTGGGLVWVVALIDVGGADAVTSLAMLGFAAASFAAGHALAALGRDEQPVTAGPAAVADDLPTGWIEEDV